MRNLMISTLIAGTAIAVAAPAAAQYPVQQPRYGYNQGYGQQNWLFDYRNQRYARMMQDRVQRIRQDIRQMGAMRVLSRAEVRDLDREAQAVERRIWRHTRGGVSFAEARQIDNRVRRLEQRVMREANDWNRRPGVRRYNPYNYNQYYQYYGNNYGYDRDRDGRIDRYEDDRGTRRDR